ncbi:unnamed protein product [Hymenolepis diminuta]|uniref:RanBD1 domain-containing protein n=1 Tax=Hymenolepis diminuta TaxID=6216 RepID=A0A0R3SGN8_HYMDI|nr:unnamed protein product [Hymenolepis diminuta]VUZ44986.1 unnamed protein product [Hymenolepis diminuta]
MPEPENPTVPDETKPDEVVPPPEESKPDTSDETPQGGTDPVEEPGDSSTPNKDEETCEKKIKEGWKKFDQGFRSLFCCDKRPTE